MAQTNSVDLVNEKWQQLLQQKYGLSTADVRTEVRETLRDQYRQF